MDFFKRLVVEAHRRSLWQVLGIYLAVSWGVFEASAEITERMGLPDWVPGLAFVLLLIGLPIVMATAFVQEGGPRRRQPSAQPNDPTMLSMVDLPDAAETPVASKPHLLFTWQKAVLGGIAAFLLLGITAGGYMGLRNAGVGPFASLLTAGELDVREPILIAEFRPLNGDTMLATTVTEALRVDFTQSEVVSVVEPKHVREVLQRMARDPKARVDAELAHEIAVRDNIKTYLLGELSQAGSKYVISGKLLATSDGRVLASYRETATDADDIIRAVDQLSKKLRNRIGESLKTIRAEKPLEAVSTPSLEALRKYTEASVAIDTERDWDSGITLLQEAIALDSAFAMAWRKLSVAYGNSGRGREQSVRAAVKAFEHRDRLTDAERYNTTGLYYYRVLQEPEKAINAYRMLEERDPRWPPNNLGLAYTQVREFGKAVETFRRTIAKDSLLYAGYENLVESMGYLGNLEGLDSAIDLVERRFPDVPDLPQFRAYAAALRGDYETAEAHAKKFLEKGRATPVFRQRANGDLADLAFLRGRLAEARRYQSAMLAADIERGIEWAPLDKELWDVGVEIQVRQNYERARAILESALENHPLDSIPPLNRPYLTIAQLYAFLGEPQRARQYVAKFEADVPPELRGNQTARFAGLDGYIALHEKRYADAIAAFRKASMHGPCANCSDWDLALAFEQAAMPDSAIARHEHYLVTPSIYRLWQDAMKLGYVYERLADLYMARGDRQNAARYAGKFVELWKDADAELQPRVQSKREMLRQLGARN